MKRASFPLAVAILPFIIGLPAHAITPPAEDQQPDQPVFFVLPVVECNQITGANFQAADGSGVKIVSLDAGGLLAGVGFQVGDIIIAVKGQPTNDTVNFCGQITSNKGKTVQLLAKDVNTGQFVIVNVAIPA